MWRGRTLRPPAARRSSLPRPPAGESSAAPDDSFRSHPLAHSRSFRESTGCSGKTALSSVIIHRRVPLLGRTVTRGYCSPRDIETATRAGNRMGTYILRHRYRYCASDGRQSDITAHQNSPHRQRSREMILINRPVYSPSGN